MKKLGFLFLFILTACFPKANPNNLVDAEYVKSNLDKKEVEIIDLRTPVEVELTGTIPNSKVHNYFGGGFDEFTDKLDPNKEYIVYCKSGGRSAKAAQIMEEKGLKVKNYGGGMDDWSKLQEK